MPSSLVIRMRMRSGAARRTRPDASLSVLRWSARRSSVIATLPRSILPLDDFVSAHIRLPRVGHRDRAALLLVGLHDCDGRGPHSSPVAGEGVGMARVARVLRTV